MVGGMVYFVRFVHFANSWLWPPSSHPPPPLIEWSVLHTTITPHSCFKQDIKGRRCPHFYIKGSGKIGLKIFHRKVGQGIFLVWAPRAVLSILKMLRAFWCSPMRAWSAAADVENIMERESRLLGKKWIYQFEKITSTFKWHSPCFLQAWVQFTGFRARKDLAENENVRKVKIVINRSSAEFLCRW